MSKTKCIKYQIIITYINGDKENVSCNNIDVSNFKAMKEFYDTVKEKYKNNKTISTIGFKGITKNGDIVDIWREKEINVVSNIEKEQEEYIEKNKDRDVREITKEISFALNCLKEMKIYHNNKLSECDLERSILLHETELSNNKVFDSQQEQDEYEKELFNKLKQNEIDRRFYKQTTSDLQSMFGKLKIEDIINSINMWVDNRAAFDKSPEEFHEDNKKTEFYKNDMERLNYISKYEKMKYDTVFWYKKKKKLVFIKHVGMGKKKYNQASIQIKEMK